MLKNLLSLILLFVAVNFWGQEQLSVLQFTPFPNDMTARTLAPVRDANGELTALIKVVTAESGFEFEGGSLGIVKVEPKTAEIWVYVPSGARTITIKHPQLGILRNYAYPVAIEAGRVYEMKLTHGELEVKVKERQIVTEFVIITSEPSGADVYLNNEPVGKTPFQAEKPEGRYEWRVVRDLYLAEAGVFELKSGEKQKLSLQLKPNYGTLEVISVPEAGATITVNGFKTGYATPFVLEEVPAGELTLTLMHEWYETTTQKVTVIAGDPQKVEITMNPNFAELTVQALADEEVYINNSRKGKGTLTQRLPPGVYSVEVRKAGHASAVKQVNLVRGDKQTINVTTEPELGTLKVLSEPMEAEIYVNGKLMGTTPQIIRDLQAGEYEIELKIAGYGSAKDRVTVKASEIAEVNLTILNTGAIRFTSEPSGAELYINGEYKGRTPYSANGLLLGEYAFELRKTDYDNITGNVQVESGTTTEVFKRLAVSRKPHEPEMVFVQGGTFTMGCTDEQGPDCGSDEKPLHQVTVNSFLIAKFEVTQAQWRAVLGDNPSYFSGCDECPVESVNWEDVENYIYFLNLGSTKKYRLPTEAEWEYAARGGNQSQGFRYAGSDDIGSVAFFTKNSNGKTHPVGQLQANELGIHDMSGNVWEWCQDHYDDYSSSAQFNPEGPRRGSTRVLRGGSFESGASFCRTAMRNRSVEKLRPNYVGLRLVLSVSE